MSTTSVPWLTSLECSAPTLPSSENSSFFSVAIKWLRFILLSPCPQRVLCSSVDLVFLLTLLVLAVQKLCHSRFTGDANSTTSSLNKPLLETKRLPHFRVYASFVVTALLGLAYIALFSFSIAKGIHSAWDSIDILFKSLQAVAHIAVVVVLIAHQKKFGATVSYPMSLGAYWVASFIVACFFSSSALIRFISSAAYNTEPRLRMDDIFFLSSLPLYVYLLVVSIRGSTVTEDINNVQGDSNVSGYTTASLLSKAVWNWMNPVLCKGYKSPLTADDIPSLPPEFCAEKMALLFERSWPKAGENMNHPVLKSLARCFWKQIAFTGFLAIVRLGVMYVGPLLINTFISFASGDRSNPSEGYFLVLTLFLAKVIEVLSAHHFNFHTMKLGMLIRSSLITNLFKKGLRLSCSSRQAHGVGQIVNYMAVDSQLLSDMIPQLHSLWMMPIQLTAALFLLYLYIGVPVMASLVAIVGVIIFTLIVSRMNNLFQFRLMENRDLRMKAVNELLSNMRVIKFQAWEEHFSNKIQSFRGVEFSWLTKIMYLVFLNFSVLWSVPTLISALTFAVAIWMKVPLDAGTVFTATTVLKILQEPIRTFPQCLIYLSQAITSLNRLDNYLTSHELDPKIVEREEDYCDGRIAVEVKQANFSWDDEGNQIILKDINFEVRKGELAAIVGTVGSGKSSLLASLLGELHKSTGRVRVCGTTAYVAQTSWIQNATVQDNILFGSPMNIERYKEVIRACSLEKDMEILEHGDQTEIGERGINLSGGQKQRIQLARAVYQDTDIYFLDDIFSAVDAQTGSEIFKECLKGVLKDKTILLVTHQVDFLHNADLILLMRDGKIVQSGPYRGLLKSGMDFGALVAAHENSIELVEMSRNVCHDNSAQSPKKFEDQREANGENEESEWSKGGNSKLIEEEQRETGHVSLEVYKQYCTEAYGWWGVAAVLIASLSWQISLSASDYWLAYETSSQQTFNPPLFISVYSIIGAISCVLVVIRSFAAAVLGLKTAQTFFTQIVCSILHAPMSFFDTTPSGRILSRVSTDQANVDFLIPLFMSIAVAMYFTVISILVIMCQNAWPTIFLLIPLIWLNVWYRNYYIASSRELTRLDSLTKAPILHYFSETVSGVMSIRCFGKQGTFFQGNVDRVNANLRMDFHNNGSNEWLGFRLEFIGSALLCISTLFMIMMPKTLIGSEYVGLALSYGLSLNGVLFWCAYITCFMENRMVSVERIKQFIKIPSEATWKIAGCLPSTDWPTRGDIEIKDLKVRYRHNTALVLKGISLSIHGGEKIGIVGRTGSGKSTMIQVLFRLVEPCAGTIVIDGVDICTLGLHDLRSRFGVIPQEPVLFEGTVRSNIDPLGLYSDQQIWKSLERCQLKQVVADKHGQLDASVADAGDNWSVGQRQLLCLGRVMLKNSRIVFMDEATASVDSQTDVVIQRVIRDDFLDSTIITIAHRIPTVIDCDRVLVVDEGWAKEFDSPAKLMERPSLFAALVQEYSNRSSAL
ncbi:PREDICTED: ABC transporter C family member 4-like [Ipomoea nil]|uniref:ABC transporter C family member 4-like n=1 Tax=Ipomoea nil TaxID=35883 RepID=UPI0009011626|nr:PREDICTED: ABC transporter C family member 4-like [Ipomoea nil]XP_019172875.1 PREDICTED: ABC transporter C family member 4-like [Ipomoea nil]XP_019172876.1 PREDICTED: ABC transporter C family member 4-like [Ipomoea nil]